MTYTSLPSPTDFHVDAVAAWENTETGEVVACVGFSLWWGVISFDSRGSDGYTVVQRVRSHKDNALAAARRYMR